MLPIVRDKVGNLPVELTSFVGRRRELTEAKRLLSLARLVTLTGVGGVGKTRLAVRVASNARRAFDDGVWLIELGELNDPDLLADTVVAALGLRKQSSNPSLELLAEHLADRRVLLLLDNCEHLVEAAAVLAETLLRQCPGLRILATSREPLGIGGEAVMRVPPLTVPDPDRPPLLPGLPGDDAVTLFVARAEAAAPGFVLSESNRVTVTLICQRLDGLPLAIELAAARLRVLSPQQILDRLTDRYGLLTAGSRGAPARHQTLKLSIDWSYDLCEPVEQQLWARLSVFAGGFELDAAESLGTGLLAREEVLDVVARLVDQSILIREEAGTVAVYRLLESLREYGYQKLREMGEEAALRRRHRDWCLQLVKQAEEEWIGPHQLAWITRLEREQPNMRDALQFCVTEPGEDEAEAGLQIAAALHTLWLTHGLLSEGRCWLDRVLAHHSGQPTTERIKALSANAALAAIHGDLRKGAVLVEEGLALAAHLGGTGVQAIVTHADGLQALFGGDLPRAVACFEAALEGFRAEGDLMRLIEDLVGLELASGLLGDMPRAIACKEEVLAITELYGESVQRACSLWAFALAVWQTDHMHASRLLEQSVRLARVVDDRLNAAMSLEALAWIAAADHLDRRAAVLLGAAAALSQTVVGATIAVPTLLTYHDECVRQARRALGMQVFDEEVRHGEAMTFENAVAYALGEEHRTASLPRADTATGLTKRERQVAGLVAEGLTNKAIAAQLVISPRTAQGHVEHVLTKLGFTSRAQIAAWVVERGETERTGSPTV
ncbi:ATP-binding protein [Rhodococcus opacus]|uniref:ATP-binding protein n=1 Tax=Rhodococcus opacus TaxID=37919 RepID=UPI0029551186|nr:LuxR C-terminal-related transcriptional regulator [Rhodococcus opacus]MDV7089163.1 LuxR C-terminal-related transcriptional regulator [Rhodococcus opacus]